MICKIESVLVIINISYFYLINSQVQARSIFKYSYSSCSLRNHRTTFTKTWDFPSCKHEGNKIPCMALHARIVQSLQVINSQVKARSVFKYSNSSCSLRNHRTTFTITWGFPSCKHEGNKIPCMALHARVIQSLQVNLESILGQSVRVLL